MRVISNYGVMMYILRPVIFLLSLTLVNCIKDKVQPVEPVEQQPKTETPPPQSISPSNVPPDQPKPQQANSASLLGPETCITQSAFTESPPFYLAETGIIVTRILKPCVTRDGLRGYEVDTPWMAMGFPCTNGGGAIDWKGHYMSPKMITFVVSTNCPMSPSATDVRDLGFQKLKLSEKSKLLAHNPFAVQYWEIPEHEDADTGYHVSLRSQKGLEETWQKFLNKEPLRVYLYGRENAWVQGDYIYFVEADLLLHGKESFKLNVLSAKVLAPAEIEQVKKRCESLRPRRKCGEVFRSH